MDKIFDEIGGFGRFQKLVLIVIGAMSSLNAMAIFATVFIAAEPKLLCKYRDDNSSAYFNETFQCTAWSNIAKSKAMNTSSPYECNWDDTWFGKTIITEYELICDRVYLAGLTQTIFMIGGLVSFFMGYLSDKYGRKFVCLIMALIMWLTFTLNEILQIDAIGLSIDAKYAVYFVSQFSIGFTSYVLYITSYVLLLELTVSRYNTIVSNVNLYLYVFGEILALIVAYLSKNWHTIDWFLAVYSFVIVLLVVIVLPESPRFLVTKSKYKEAYQVLNKIAKLNGTSSRLINEKDFVSEMTLSNEKNINNGKYTEVKQDLKTPEKKKSNELIQFLLNPKFNLIITMILSYVWIAVSLTFYGVSLGITSISSNFDPYLMYFFSSLAEVVGYISCHLNDKFSRKKVMIGFLGTAGLVCLAVAVIPKDNASGGVTWDSALIILFASFGKAAASAAFNSGYVLTSKLYPTNVRSTLASLVLSIGRVGSLISPQINLLRTLIWAPLPYLIFGSSSMIACLSLFFLPEITE